MAHGSSPSRHGVFLSVKGMEHRCLVGPLSFCYHVKICSNRASSIIKLQQGGLGLQVSFSEFRGSSHTSGEGENSQSQQPHHTKLSTLGEEELLRAAGVWIVTRTADRPQSQRKPPQRADCHTGLGITALQPQWHQLNL